jgi:serine phosphatase RsbU (regulator of sigma subunit)/catechol 2,3-dioxygenase-like lactoylglutathione lyase family enzyme
MDSSVGSRLWGVGPAFRLDRENPYLRLQNLTLFVRDQDRSLRFFVDLLGFSLIADRRVPEQSRWVAVAPPDGTAILALVTPKPDQEEYRHIGQARQIVLITEDVDAIYQLWLERGVSFLHPPKPAPAGVAIFTTFEDPDGNSFALAGFDQITQEIENQRRQADEKLQSDRRTAHEMEIATQVQARLFPQRMPHLRTLEYHGICIQARQVGGDYYDFLDLGRDRFGLVIADIAGKGIGAALLMANLQANLRSQCALVLDQMQNFLQSVNQLFYENTTDTAYATFFFAEYDDQTRCLRYANCGHLSPLLLRHDSSLERLHPTSTVLGLFEQWNCSIEETRLFPGDILVLYTDGLTEASNEEGEEFGEERLCNALRRHRDLSSQSLLASIVDEVRLFNAGEQQDDITVMVANCEEAKSI